MLTERFKLVVASIGINMKSTLTHDNPSLKGKILRIKHGYNPNSSSIGSVIFALPVALFGVTLGFGVISSIIMSKFIKNENIEKHIPENDPNHNTG